MRLLRNILIAIVFVALAGCNPPNASQTIYQKERRYNQDVKVNVAALVKEQNNYPVRPMPNCSGFLVDKARGLFGSAKHCIGATGRWKIFYAGKVYDGRLLSVPAISDLVLIKTDANLNSLSGAPDPYPVASSVKIGDKVFVRGIHPHPPEYLEGRRVVPIWSEYYGIYWAPFKLVFDDLEAEVVSISNPQIGRELGLTGVTAELTSIFYKIKTVEDHKQRNGFSGLSGGPVANDRGELVGVLSWQRVQPEEEEFRLETEEFVIEGKMLRPVYREVNVVPAKELEELIRQAPR